MTKEQYAITLSNLRTVARELPELAKTQPSIITDFNMELFGIYMGISLVDLSENVCGTAGCLMGNAARLFDVKADTDLFEPTGGSYFARFSYHLFGYKYFPALYETGILDWEQFGTPNWDFVFSGLWADIQSTFELAIQRLEHLITILEAGTEITTWSYEKDMERTIAEISTQPIVFEP